MVSKVGNRKITGFTIIELMTVVAIIAVIASIIMISLGDARTKSRDTTRIQQVNEVLKAMELYYAEYSHYPDSGTSGEPIELKALGSIDIYMAAMPSDPIYPPARGYYYCASLPDRDSIALFVNTEKDKGPAGSDYCVISRGPREYQAICNATNIGSGEAIADMDRCIDRIK